MKKLLDYIKLAVLLGGVLMGVQIPGLVDQYGSSLDSRVSESGNSIAEFQDDADKYYGGDINKLIAHYDNKSDPVIVSGGESIGALVSRNQYLAKAQREFHRSAYSAYIHVFISPVEEVRYDVWSNYTYKVILNGSAITIAIVSGLIALGLFELTFFLLGLALPVLSRSRYDVAAQRQDRR